METRAPRSSRSDCGSYCSYRRAIDYSISKSGGPRCSVHDDLSIREIERSVAIKRTIRTEVRGCVVIDRRVGAAERADVLILRKHDRDPGPGRLVAAILRASSILPRLVRAGIARKTVAVVQAAEAIFIV